MKLGTIHLRLLRAAAYIALLAFALPFSRALGGELTIEQLKDRVANAEGVERASLCVRISERQLEAAAKSFQAGEDGEAEAALADVVAFSALARDYAIQSHKREKESEIAVRKMIRKLDGLKHEVAHEDQKSILESIQHLEQVRDDLLAAMFPKVRK
jgi:hypothetical protein